MKPLSPKILLHAEGLAVLVVACVAYHGLHAAWLWFAVLFLAPDLSMIGYAFGVKPGAMAYNAAHTYVGPLLLGVLAYLAPAPSLYSYALIWTAHIGFDRLLGYGLKYDTAFKDTHLGRV